MNKDKEISGQFQYEADSIKGDYDPNEDRMEYIENMKLEGLFPKTPQHNELFIDIDNVDDKNWFLIQFERLKKILPQISYRSNPSKSGLPNEHITVTMPFKISSNHERIAWQACLGSDSVKELLSMIRLYRGDEFPILFMEKPQWFGQGCEHLSAQWEDHLPGEPKPDWEPVLKFCNHKDNPEDTEGNCRTNICPTGRE